jgi:putative acetyltransferase
MNTALKLDPVGDGIHMPAGIVLRAGDQADAEAIHGVYLSAIHGLARGPYSEAQLRSWAAGLTAGGCRRAMARGERYEVAVAQAGDLVAFCATLPGLVQAIYTDPGWAGRGIGTVLLARAEARLFAAGHDPIRLRGALNAEGFYARRGWRAVSYGGHRTAGGLVLAAVRMEKRAR